MAGVKSSIKTLLRTDPLLGKDREISSYATAQAADRKQQENKRFSMMSVPRCYKQDKLVE
jgi:hypothetical protein